jgi:dTDP-4-dehydrorhamnose 3,5-epimerase
MKIKKTMISGLLTLEPDIIEDPRGFFLESYKASEFEKAMGRPHVFAQANHSRSQANTLRGFRKEGWDKLIYVTRGTALCVVVDSRLNSPTFGTHQKFILGDKPGQRKRIFVSEGLSNAFYCFDEVDYVNDVSGEYDPTARAGFQWNDPTIAIEWPTNEPLLSETDKDLPFFNDLFPNDK